MIFNTNVTIQIHKLSFCISKSRRISSSKCVSRIEGQVVLSLFQNNVYTCSNEQDWQDQTKITKDENMHVYRVFNHMIEKCN